MGRTAKGLGLWMTVWITVEGSLAPFAVGVEADLEKVLETARKIIQSKDYQGAIVYLKTAREKTPHPKISLELAEAYFQAKQEDEATAAFEEVLSLMEKRKVEGPLSTEDEEVLRKARGGLDRLVRGAKDLRDVNSEVLKKWLRFAEKMLQQKNPRMALKAVELMETIDPLNREAEKLRQDPRLVIERARRHAVMLLDFEREKSPSRGKQELVRDRSGRGNDGAIRGARLEQGPALEALSGQWLVMEGEQDCVQGTSPLTGFPARDSPWTVSVWIRTSRGSGGTILYLGGEDGKAAWLRLRLGMEGRLLVERDGQVAVSGKQAIDDGKWHHAAVVFQGGSSAEPLRIYIDGQEDAVGSFLVPPRERVQVVWKLGAAGEDHSLRGSVDEVSFFQRALSPKELEALHKLGKSGKGLADG